MMAARMFTPAQARIMTLLNQGLSTDQISRTLFLARATVRNHIQAMLLLTHTHSRLQLVTQADHWSPEGRIKRIAVVMNCPTDKVRQVVDMWEEW